MSGSPVSIKVVAGVLENALGSVLLAQRPAGKAMAGGWEFPGGKLLEGEAPALALVRELREELGIEVQGSRPLISLHHDYPELSVDLAIFSVTQFRGEPRALEDQQLAWVPRSELGQWDLLEADRPVVAALQLPDRCLVTPAPDRDVDSYLHNIQSALEGGLPMVQCRLPEANTFDRLALGRAVRELCREHDALFIWNGTAAEAQALDADGLHLNSRRLMALETRPLADCRWVGASCHTADEVQQANRLGLDYIFIGSVQPTPSHPAGPVLGWDGFGRLTALSNLPTYAIGGMTPGDFARVRSLGGQGIASIRNLLIRSPTFSSGRGPG
ncbi:MAG TPA: Nudix family hydrolase [Gammaproteobacteria bacterium]|nr:Nudix family hydrolase [Gammaproteobacteria bacterium]